MTHDQKPYQPGTRFDNAEFALNPEPRCPCVLVLDTSGSMSGAAISALNEGVQQFASEIQKDPLAAQRVEVAIITFGPVRKALDFTTAMSFVPPPLVAEGVTPMGEAILRALDTISARKLSYKSSGISYYRPWIFLITDGAPTDSVEAAGQRIREAEANKSVAFFAVGVQGADLNALAQISVRPPIKLQGLQFREMFSWLSSSLQRVSQSQVGQEVSLPAVGWGAV